MSTGKHQDQASNQLQLFGCTEHDEAALKPSAPLRAELPLRPGLRLITGGINAERLCAPDSPENLTAIAARLVGRARFF